MGRCWILCWYLFANIVACSFSNNIFSQDQPATLPEKAGLNSCLKYALEHQPLINQLRIRDEIVNKNIAIALSDWFPQIDASASYQHYLKQPVSIFPDFTNPDGPKREVTTGVKNTSALQLNASQVIYNPDVLSAGRSARYYRQQSEQSNQERMISLVIDVSKAYYDVLLTEAKLDFYLEDQSRIEKSRNDARSLFESGISDKIDYQRAQISLNNIAAEISGTQEEIKAKYAFLKELMGYPAAHPLSISSDSINLAGEAWIDTTEIVRYQDRVEYQLLSSNIMLQKTAVSYYRTSFLPSVSAYANYNLVYQNDQFDQLYDRDFPNSSAGLRLTLPLFEGSRRMQQLQKAKLRLRDMALDSVNLKSRISTEYETAMASYKSNLKALSAAQSNLQLAEGIYNTVRLQYNQGIKSFLEVIVSEADLRTSKINELNAFYRLLTSKLDVEAALGKISVNY